MFEHVATESQSLYTMFFLTAMMDIPILLGGRLEGVLRYEQVSPPARWQPEDRLFGIAVANLIALAIEQGERGGPGRRSRTAKPACAPS